MIKVLIADDQELIRESLKIILEREENFEIIGIAKNGREVINMIRGNKPDVIIMDVRMPTMDGVQCSKVIKEVHQDIKIIILTTFDDEKYISDSFTYGVEGYLLKGDSVKKIVEAINTVYGGGVVLNSRIASKLVKIYATLASNSCFKEVKKEVIESITKTERKIIELVEKGQNNKEIAENLCLSEGTVRNYLSSILTKLELRDRTQLAIWGLENIKG